MKNKLYRLDNNKFFFGLCSGLRESYDVPLKVSRTMFILLTLIGGSGIIIYLISCLLIQKKNKITEKRFLGVFGFLSNKFNLDLTHLRFYAGWVLILFAHYGVIIYLLLFLWVKTIQFSSKKTKPKSNNQD